MSIALSALGAYGTWLLYTALALGWKGLRPAPTRVGRRRLLGRAGLAARVGPPAASTAVVMGATGTGAWAMFGGTLPPVIAALVSGVAAHSARRRRITQARAAAQQAWPRMIEEIRLLVGASGRSVPQALLEVGQRGPDSMRDAFKGAARVWRLSTDFERTVNALTESLADPTADVVCDVLLVSHQTGATDLDSRLLALAEDRATDLRHRRDAIARQAGVRFARRFVLAVPIGMAACGLSIGRGRAAYGTPTGQLLVCIGIVAVAACWVWAGSLLRLPQERRSARRAST